MPCSTCIQAKGVVHMFWRVTPGIWRSSASGLMYKNSYPLDQQLSSPDSQVSLCMRPIGGGETKYIPPLGVRYLLLPLHSLRQLLVRPKDCVPTDEQVVICQVLCLGFPAIYIGQTGRCLDKNLKEHSQAVETGNSANSALRSGPNMRSTPYN